MKVYVSIFLFGILLLRPVECQRWGQRKKGDKDNDKEYTDMEDMSEPTSEDFPQQLKVKFQVKGKPMELSLRRNMRMSMDVPIVVGKGPSLKTRMMHGVMAEKMGVYMDANTGASIIVNNKNGKKKYRGTFFLDNEEYYLEPMEDHSPAERKRRGRGRHDRDSEEDLEGEGDFEHTDSMYVVTEMEEEEDTAPGSYESMPMPPDNVPSRATKLDENEVLPSTGSYNIEMLVLIDFSTYQKWLNFSEGSTDEEKEMDALRNIQFFYTQVINGVAIRYQSIDEQDIKMDTTLSGFYIATDIDAAPFSRDNTIVSTPRNFVDADKTMRAMQEWLDDHKNELPPFDQATLYVHDYLRGLTGNSILGIATISGLCSKYSTAVSRDLNHYSSAQTTAHEMGHNVGGLHDGNDNACPAADQYIMAPYPVNLDSSNFFNPFKFSACTTQEFREFIAYMDRYNYNCIEDAVSPFPDIPSILSTLPGQEYTPDEQCQLVYGPEAYYCGGATEDMNICFYMECFNPDARRCVVNSEQRAAPGTQCGNKKWCESGVCTYNSDAPVGLDYCTYGDYKGSYTDGRNCTKVGHEEPWLCYSSYYGDDCCETCAQLRNNNYPECLYGDKDASCTTKTRSDCRSAETEEMCCETCRDFQGDKECFDKASWCPSYVTKASLCYSVSDTCCATCEKYVTTEIEGCDFGDRYSNCQNNFKGQCYTNEDNCCLTCSKLKDTAAVGCEYGDKEAWCSSITSSQCYSETRCCGTCSAYHTGILGCEYGDKVSGCSAQDCDNPSRSNQCCFTCRVEETTTVTSTSASTTESNTEDCTDLNWCQRYVDEANKCYSASVEKSCCKTCRSMKVSPQPGCEYGDRAPWCSDLNQNPGGCYFEKTQRSCCDTCDKLKDETAVDCPYGDSVQWCASIARTQCYVESASCCGTCSVYETGIQGCKYGDKISSCSLEDCSNSRRKEQCCYTCRDIGVQSSSTSTETPTSATTGKTTTASIAGCVDAVDWCANLVSSRCYQDSDTCCATCSPFYDSSKVGCEFGDKAVWCEGIPVRNCYLTDYKRRCCDTCSNTVTNIRGCEYGDKISDCANRDCTNNYVKDNCCQTCAERTTTSKPSSTLSTVLSSSTTVDPFCVDTHSVCSDIDAVDCYIVSDVCCHTCKQLETGATGCLYGDQYDWCSDEICHMADLRDKCCGSCGHTSSTPSCEDQAAWCAVLDTSHCYRAATREVCCHTCAMANSGQAGCEWGDSGDTCSELTDDCDTLPPAVCCHSCKNVISRAGLNQTTIDYRGM